MGLLKLVCATLLAPILRHRFISGAPIRDCEAGQRTSVPDIAANHKRINVDDWIHVV